jgi:EAL and modified HD-GYP domain-containing signal transduction protein
MLERLKLLTRQELLRTSSAADSDAQPEQQAVVARQPVFDQQGLIWGYELLYRHSSAVNSAGDANGSMATASVIVNGFEIARAGLTPKQKLLINFTSDMIEAQVIKLLPREICVMEILETVEPTEELLAAVSDIKKAGYSIALDDYIGQKSLQPFIPLADIIKVDVLGLAENEIAMRGIEGRGGNRLLLAEKVEDQRMVSFCRSLGFHLFQGFFFSKPNMIQGKKVSMSQAMRMQILTLCASEEADIKEITVAILHDPIITANFLRFANSAAFGLRQKVTSVHRAVALIGPEPLMRWLCVNMLAALERNPISYEMAFLASQRARFLENLGKQHASRRILPPGVSTSSLFLVGLFSLLESLAGMPLDSILEGVPVDQDVLTALSGGTSLYTPWLRLMDHYERGEWDAVMSLAGSLNFTETDLSEAYATALEWTSAFFQRNPSANK